MIVSFDSETTGLDVHHGARPFYVSTCSEDGRIKSWEWAVDPLTRNVDAPEEELEEVRARLALGVDEPVPYKYAMYPIKVGLDVNTPSGIVLDALKEKGCTHEAEELERVTGRTLVAQNSKFDVAMLRALFRDRGHDLKWDWGRTHDTLIMGHLLASNKPHDLTSMAIQYLGHDIQPLEDALEVDVKAARRFCQHRLTEWMIAKDGLEDMPSAGAKTWKYDTWLPKALAAHLGFPEPQDSCKHTWAVTEYQNGGNGVVGCTRCGGCRWYLVLRGYADADAEITVALFRVMMREIDRRNYTDIYHASLKRMELAHRMEWRGVTASKPNLELLRGKYREESTKAGEVCKAVAARLGYDLELPKAGMNNSLRHFCFGRNVYSDQEPDTNGPATPIRRDEWLRMPVVKRTDGGEPSMDKTAMEEYRTRIQRGTDQWEFLVNLQCKRKRDTALSYLEGYERFWLPLKSRDGPTATWRDFHVLHPNLNPCGTDTLRWSSNHPNEQNISKQGMLCMTCFGDGDGDGPDGKCRECGGKGLDPRSLRMCFVAPPGYELWSFDAKNIELRLPFYKAGEKELIDLFERPDDPPYYGSNHLLNFHTIYEDIWNAALAEVGVEKVGPHCKKKYASTWYQHCKNMGFAKQYGAQKAKVDATAHRAGAYELIEARFSQLAKLNAECVRYANKFGYVETWPDRTVDPLRGYPLLCTRTENGGIKPTVPLSYKVQGTAMWWTMKAMMRVQELLDKWNAAGRFDAYLFLQVHDELVIAMPRRGNPALWKRGLDTAENRRVFLETNLWRAEKIRAAMALGGDDLGVPTPVGCEFHPEHWGEGATLA